MNDFSKLYLYGKFLKIKDEFARTEIEKLKNKLYDLNSSANMQKNEILSDNGTVLFKFNNTPDEKNIPILISDEHVLFSDKSIILQSNITAKYNVNLECKKNDTLCLFLYASIESAKNTNWLTVKLNNNEKYQFLFSEYVYKNGWNCLKFTVNEKVDINTIQIDMQVKDNTSKIFLDSIIVNYKYNPKIVLSFDNCNDASLFGHIFPILKEYGFPASFSFQNGSIPDESGILTTEHLKELLKNGWDYSVYNTINQNESALKEYLARLETKNIYNPICYSNPGNVSTSEKIRILKKLGFKMERVSSALNYDGFFNKDSFDLLCFDQRLTGLENAKKIIDACIKNGSNICSMYHLITETGSEDLSISDNVAREFFNYLKNYQDQSKLEVVTFSTFYGCFYPSDLINTKTIINAKKEFIR